MATPSISGSDGIQPSDAAPAYAVGYGRPPVHTRFKPGHPGRGGRPKGQRNMRTVMEGFLKEPVTVREGTRQRKMSKRDAMLLRIVNEAVSGNDKAQAKVIAMAMTETAEAINQEPFTADDPAVIADFLRRLGNPAPPTQPPERNVNPEAGAAKPARSEANKTKEAKS
jgi:Family of unknown function (DUF5681)